MRVNVSYVQRCKATAHIFQVLLTFVAGCITLAVMTKDGDTGAATKFYFALVGILAGWSSEIGLEAMSMLTVRL